MTSKPNVENNTNTFIENLRSHLHTIIRIEFDIRFWRITLSTHTSKSNSTFGTFKIITLLSFRNVHKAINISHEMVLCVYITRVRVDFKLRFCSKKSLLAPSFKSATYQPRSSLLCSLYRICPFTVHGTDKQ